MFDSLWTGLYRMLYFIDIFFCKILSILYSFFDVFAGIANVTYAGKRKPLINVFFDNTPAGNIYKYMAIIGIALSFAFTIYAVIKKIFDIDDKMKNSLGGIIGNQLKCILFILLMNFVISIALLSSNTLMERIVYAFNNAPSEADSQEHKFTEDEYATMARIINTIGNYSLNPSYDSRYNINTCYNEIREELSDLERAKVFKFTYEEYDNSWQYYIARIANAHDLSVVQNVDEYNETLTAAITACMDQIRLNNKFVPINYYKNDVKPIRTDETPFDALIFLAGTSKAAKNEKYNKAPDIFDALRYEYIRPGGKSIYDEATVSGDFDLSFSKFDHLAIIILGVILAKVFLSLCINCIARIFNLMLLYLIAPIFIAITPLDDGEKTKQWSIAFIVQAFAVFGAVFGIRILMMFVAMIFNADLILFEDATMNFFAKLIMVFAVAVTIEQASKIVTGILANNAGFQSIQASDVGSAGASRIIAGAQRMGGKALGTAGAILNHSPLGTIKNAVGSALANSALGKLGGMLTGTGDYSRAAFDKAHEPKNNTSEQMAESAKTMADAAKSFSDNMAKFQGGSSGDGGGDSAGGAAKGADTAANAKNNSDLGNSKPGGSNNSPSQSLPKSINRPRTMTFSGPGGPGGNPQKKESNRQFENSRINNSNLGRSNSFSESDSKYKL